MQYNFSAKKTIEIIYRFKSTISITLLILVSFIFFSNANFFISTKQLLNFALTSFQLENAIHYMLIHVGYNHLAVNLVSFIAFSLVAEYCLGSKHAFAIFWISGILSGIIFVSLNPNIALIGASAGVSGLLGAAFVSNWKKTIIAIIAMLFATIFFVYPLTTGAFDEFKKDITQKQAAISQDLNKAIQQKDFNKAADLNKNLQQTTQTIEQTQKGEKFAKDTPISNEIHAIGAIIGIGYVLILRNKNKFFKE